MESAEYKKQYDEYLDPCRKGIESGVRALSS